MSCKGKPKERVIALALLGRLHSILCLQAECGANLTEGKKKLLSKAVYATYTDLSELGHKKAALWYAKRKPKKIIFLRCKREKALLGKIKSLGKIYIAAHDAAAQKESPEASASKVAAYSALEEHAKKAVRIGLKKEAADILKSLGLLGK